MSFFGLGESEAGKAPTIDAAKAQSLAQVNGDVKSKHGGPRPGSGRPSKGGKPANQVVGKPATPQAQQDQVEASEADIEFVRTIAKAGMILLDRAETNIILGTIKAIDDKYITERADAFLKQREISDADIEIVVNASGAIAAKYSFLSRYAPEGALLLWTVTHGLAFSNVLQSLKQVAAESKKAKGVKNANGPQTD